MMPAVATAFRGSGGGGGGGSTTPTLNLANFLDASGNGSHLMVGGSTTPTFASDPFGIGQDALNFDGTVIASAQGNAWSPATYGSDWTYQFRFKRDTGHLGTTQILFGRWSRFGGSTTFQFLCYFDTSNNLNFLISGTALAGASTNVSAGAISDGAAHAVMVVMTGSNLSIYLDGVLMQTTAAVSVYVAPYTVPMLFGTYSDTQAAASAGGFPFRGVFGDFMISNVARHTGSSYTVPSTPAVSDANTLILQPFDSVHNQYLETPTYQGNALVRGSHSQASGGWANPDGPLVQIGGGYYFTVSGFDGAEWTVWAVKASTLSALLSGAGTLGAAAIQTPTGGEGSLAGNGSVVPFQGQYWHFYHDAGSPIRLRCSTGSSLDAPFSPQPGNIVFTGYFDPFVRVSSDGSTLIMFMGSGSTSQRTWWVTTSTDGTTWTTPVEIIGDTSQAGFAGAPGEFSVTQFTGDPQWGFSDGAPTGTTTRDVTGWGSLDGLNWTPLFMRLSATGTGNDAGGHAYLGVYDSSPYWDVDNQRLVILTTLSTNTQPTQPTDSDIAVWFVDVANI